MPLPDHQQPTRDMIANRHAEFCRSIAASEFRSERGASGMTRVSRAVDLTQVPAVPWAWVDEHVYAAIRACSVKVLQSERRLNTGCPFRRINGTTIRYKMGDIAAFMESQPGGGGCVKPIGKTLGTPGRPKKINNLTVTSTQSHE